MRGVKWFVLAGMLVLTVSGLYTAARALSESSGRAPAGYTDAPGDGTCYDCHTGSINTGTTLTISIPGLVGTAYTPGTSYDVRVEINRSGAQRWGFSLTALRDSDNAFAGSLGPLDLLTTTRVQSSTGRTYISHTDLNGPDGTFAGMSGPQHWDFDWTAPAAGNGDVTLYASGVAANNNGQNGNTDHAATARLTLTESGSTPVAALTWGAIKKRIQ